MRILVGDFQIESNEHVPTINTIKDFVHYEGYEIVKNMHISDLCEKYNVEAIPGMFYEMFAGGLLEKKSFEIIENELLNSIKNNINDIDGIYLFLHGASEVVGLEGGSGEHHIIKEVRKLVGKDMPIALVMDPHGNTSKDFVETVNILRCFRQSPHTDNIDTRRLVFKLFVEYLNNNNVTHAVYQKLPLILGGETSVSTDEPMMTINKYLDEKEKDDRIKSCSFHIGYIRHDSKIVGCGVVVVPESDKFKDYAKDVASDISTFIMDRRKEFHYTGKTLNKEEAIKDALNFKGKPYFITDSGDNVTSGSTGYNTYVLRQFLAVENLDKKVLFASITDPKTLKELINKDIKEKCSINLGMAIDELSETVNLDVQIKTKGDVSVIGNRNMVMGKSVTVDVIGKNITIVIIGNNTSFAEKQQYEASNIKIDDYDIIVVKQGYIFPELKAMAKDCCMSLTDGATYQDVKSIGFKLIERPMYPIDEF